MPENGLGVGVEAEEHDLVDRWVLNGYESTLQ